MTDKPSEELIKKCKEEVQSALSSSIRHLFDDSSSGGEFYAHIVMQMVRHYDDPRIPTAAVSVSNKINLYVNSYFFVHELVKDLNPKTQKDQIQARRAAVIKHEILHCIFQHMLRGKDFGNPKLANIAADLVVNSCIDKSILNCGLFPEDFNLPKDKTLDWYYTNFPVEENPLCSDPSGHDKQHSKGSSDGKDSSSDRDNSVGDDGGEGEEGDHSHSATDSNGKCKVCGGVRTLDSHDIWGKDGNEENMSQSMKESLIKDAINQASQTIVHTGNLPAVIQQEVELAKKKAVVPWQLLLKQFVSKVSAGLLTQTKKRKSRRYRTRPGTRITPKLKLLVAVDVSGSVQDNEYQMFFDEINAIAKNVGEIEVVEFDAAICSVYKFKHTQRTVTRSGCGGNDLRPMFEWLEPRKDKYDGIIWFTDGYFCGYPPPKRYKIPSIWVLNPAGTDVDLKTYRVVKLPNKEVS